MVFLLVSCQSYRVSLGFSPPSPYPVEPGAFQSLIPVVGEVRPEIPFPSFMAATDPVPCYYTGQNYRWERPAEIRTRAEVHQLKRLKLGQFVDSGKIFLFFQKVAEWATQNWNGRVGVGTTAALHQDEQLRRQTAL